MVMAVGLGTAEGSGSRTSFPLESLVDGHDVQGAKSEVRRCIDRGLETIELDFGGVLGVSSDLINFLIWCQMECNRNHVLLRVKHVTPEMMRAFRFAGLNQVIDLKSDR